MSTDNSYSGYTNIQIADELGNSYCAVGMEQQKMKH